MIVEADVLGDDGRDTGIDRVEQRNGTAGTGLRLEPDDGSTLRRFLYRFFASLKEDSGKAEHRGRASHEFDEFPSV
jgi:hypothetical protein